MTPTLLAAVVGIAGLASYDPVPLPGMIPGPDSCHYRVWYNEDEPCDPCNEWASADLVQLNIGCWLEAPYPIEGRVETWERNPGRWTRWWHDEQGWMKCDDPDSYFSRGVYAPVP